MTSSVEEGVWEEMYSFVPSTEDSSSSFRSSILEDSFSLICSKTPKNSKILKELLAEN